MTHAKTQPSSIDRRVSPVHVARRRREPVARAVPGRGLFARSRFGDQSLHARRRVRRSDAGRHRAVDAAGARAGRSRQPRQAADSGRLARRPPTAACATWSRAAWPARRPSSRIRCTSRWTACGRAATTSISSTCAARRARSATSAPRRREHEMAREIRFAFATCQDWPSGYYTAYRDMLRARSRPGAAPRRLHLRIRDRRHTGAASRRPTGSSEETVDLRTYRLRHTLLQAGSRICRRRTRSSRSR